MKDLSRLVAECQRELDAIGIPYSKSCSFAVNTRAQCRWGLCKRLPDGTFDISISAKLLQDNVDDIAAKNTIIHELIHTVKGCVGHRDKWKALAYKVNTSYPQYHIKRTTDYEEKGIERPKRTPRQYTVKYLIRCTRCGSQIYRKKTSKAILHPERYRCGKCGGKLEVAEV